MKNNIYVNVYGKNLFRRNIRVHLARTFSLSNRSRASVRVYVCVVLVSTRSFCFYWTAAAVRVILLLFSFFLSYLCVICNLFGHIHILLHFSVDHAAIFPVVASEHDKDREKC